MSHKVHDITSYVQFLPFLPRSSSSYQQTSPPLSLPALYPSIHSETTTNFTVFAVRPSSPRRLPTPPTPSSLTASLPGAVLARLSPPRSRSSATPTPTPSSTRSTSTNCPRLLPSSVSVPCPLSCSSRTARSSTTSPVPTPRVWSRRSRLCLHKFPVDR